MRPRHLFAWLILLLAGATPGHTLEAGVTSAKASRIWQLAAQEQAILDQRGVILKEASLCSYLQDVVERLWEHVQSQLSIPTVKIIANTRIDAHAYPNGVIFLSTGILDVLENESQLAMTLAHEMVHYVHQHTTALYNHFQPASLNGDRQEAYGGGSTITLAIRQIIDAAERQADREGLTILRAAGYCDKEVLPLMDAFMIRMVEQDHPESLSQLNKRAAWFNAMVNQDGAYRTDCASMDTDANRYRCRVAPALMANAQHAVRGGDWDQATRSIAKFLESEPQNAQAYYLKGEILRHQYGCGHESLCINAYEKALEVDPTFPPTHRALGELHYKAGRCHMAKPYFETFLNLAPEDTASAFITGYLKQCQN
jgi:predicted Zn-dependent protease